ncbi:MAG: endo-1,4-beta-xylanase [Elusimicrobiota bacterium]
MALRSAFLSVAFAASAWGAPAPELPAGTPLLPADTLKAYLTGFSRTDSARLQIVAVPGEPFGRAARVTTLRRPEKTYRVQLSAKTIAAVKKGDALLARFYVRALNGPAGARAEFVFERAGGDYQKSSMLSIAAREEWRRVDHPFLAQGSYAPGEAQVNFRLGFDPQVIEIAGVQVLRLERGAAALGSAPSRAGYAGRDRYAPWRQAAAARIERWRKGDLTVTVKDAAGRPIPGAAVRVRMLRHAFGFGGAVNARFLQTGDETPDKRRYRAEVARLFNVVVIDNALKWSQWDEQKDWGLATVRWLQGLGIAVRGHNLVWPGWSHLPKGLSALAGDPRALRRRVAEHIGSAVGLLKGQVSQWDVLNEPYDNTDLTRLLGRHSQADWFRLARQADPAAKLYVNETGVLNLAGEDRTLQDAYEKNIRFLLDAGAPLDGIGLQAHFDLRLTPPARLVELLDRFARFGKPLVVTEFDLDVHDEMLQADYLRDFMTAAFSQPAVEAIVLWEFWQGLNAGNPAGAVLFRKDWSLKPSGRQWQDLVYGRWWTSEDCTSDGAGRCRVRGFLGSYEITATGPGGQRRPLSLDLTREGAVVELRLGDRP